MAITALNDYAIGDVNFNTMMTSLDKTFKGKADITISAYDTTAAPDVKVGSVFENNGSLFIVDTADITPTGYAGITTSTTFYLYYDESATAFIYSNTAPTWSDALQGWYNGNDRAFFSMYKDSGDTLYELKEKLRTPDVIQDLTIGNDLTMGGQVVFKKYLKDSGAMNLYTVFSSWVSSSYPTRSIRGSINGTITGVLLGVTYASGTTLKLAYMNASDGAYTVQSLTSVSNVTVNIEVMSNFEAI